MKQVIIACDFKDKDELNKFLVGFEGLNPYLKIGMEIFYKEGPELVKDLIKRGYHIFLDLKLHDIPNTVHKAMKNIASLNVDITNVHAAGGVTMMRKAKEALEGTNTKLIAVTVLTSLNEDMLHDELNINTSLKDTVYKYAKNAKEAGLDGIVCSPLEAPLAKELGFMSVTPGIRLEGDSKDDQQRVTTPKMASDLGSTYIVVGRSITGAKDPVLAYKRCMEEFNND